MFDVVSLGWNPKTLGEIDHERVQAPYVRLSSFLVGDKGDTTYVFDLRFAQPNEDALSSELMHSLEHLLLAGFRKHFPVSFVCVAPMGCQTGFYLVLLNEGRAEKLLSAFEGILQEILSVEKVPYVHISQCGNYRHHDLSQAQKLAKELLRCRAEWRDVLREGCESVAC